MRVILPVVMCVLSLAACVLAQGVQPFSDLSLEEALHQSKRTKRLLIVYPRAHPRNANLKRAFDLTDKELWTNPTVDAFIKWHAIAVKVDELENPRDFAMVWEQARQFYNTNQLSIPVILVYRDGVLEWSIPNAHWQHFMVESNRTMPGKESLDGTFPGLDERAFDVDSMFHPKPVHFLYGLDFYLEKLRSTKAVWLMAHEAKNPMPAAPPVPAIHAINDDLAPAVDDPPPGECPLSRVMLARQLVKAGDLYQATGVYTWLYERLDAMDPALRPARLWLAQEMADLARKRTGSRDRFSQIRNSWGQRQPWNDYEQSLDWIILNAVVGEVEHTVDFFIMFTVDQQEQAMLPLGDRVAYDLLLARGAWTDPARLDGTELNWLARQSRRLNIPTPRGTTDEEWQDVQRLRRLLFVAEACRVHAASLLDSRGGDAQRAADLLLDAYDDADSRIALSATAIVAGVAGPMHARWLDQAAAMGKPRPAMLAMIPR